MQLLNKKLPKKILSLTVAGIYLTQQHSTIVELKISSKKMYLSKAHQGKPFNASQLAVIWKKQKFTAKYVAVNIDNAAVISQRTKVPKNIIKNPRELHEWMLIEAVQLTPLSNEKIAIDYYPINDEEYLLCVCERKIVEHLTQLTQTLKLKLITTTFIAQLALKSLYQQFIADNSTTDNNSTALYNNDLLLSNNFESQEYFLSNTATLKLLSALHNPKATELITNKQSHIFDYSTAIGLAILVDNQFRPTVFL